jgi:hypothetical protein
VHDFEPGIASNGLFWTIPIPATAAEINLSQRTARFHMSNLRIPDWHDFFNSIGAGNPSIPSVSATVSFDTHWRAVGPLTRISDPAKGFQGEFMEGQATIQWSAEEPALDFQFVTDASAPTRTIGAALGREQNGVFFR